jgi:flagellar motor switch/type III secretory pathway protein FliN
MNNEKTIATLLQTAKALQDLALELTLTNKPTSMSYDESRKLTIRDLKIREQLERNKQFVGINDIKHPVHGIIPVDRDKLDQLLKYEEGHLIRFKKRMFHGDL